MDLRTVKGQKRALPVLAVCVAHGHLDFLGAAELLLRNYVTHLWKGSYSSLLFYEGRMIEALSAAIERAEALTHGESHEEPQPPSRQVLHAEGMAPLPTEGAPYLVAAG